MLKCCVGVAYCIAGETLIVQQLLLSEAPW